VRCLVRLSHSVVNKDMNCLWDIKVLMASMPGEDATG
jgi:hypothetical protein